MPKKASKNYDSIRLVKVAARALERQPERKAVGVSLVAFDDARHLGELKVAALAARPFAWSPDRCARRMQESIRPGRRRQFIPEGQMPGT